MRKLTVLELDRMSVEQYKECDKTPFVVVLDNVRSMHNVGSVFRTSDAFRVQSLYLCGITCCPPSAEIHKTALGAEETVDWVYFADTLAAVEDLHQKGYKVLALEQAENSVKLDSMVLDKDTKYAIVLGHEVKGVDQAVVDACDGCLEIPQFGTKHSLNVSVAAGLAIWEIFKQIR